MGPATGLARAAHGIPAINSIRKGNTVKRFLIALAAFGALASAAIASAATMNVSGGAIQAGSDNSLTCETGTVKVVGYADAFDAGGPTVNWINVNGVNPACNGSSLQVLVRDGSNNVFARGVLSNSGCNGNVAFDPNAVIPASNDGNTVLQLCMTDKWGAPLNFVYPHMSDFYGLDFFIDGGA
jgi:hypothetical protein